MEGAALLAPALFRGCRGRRREAAAVEACALSIFSCFFFQQPQPLNDNGLNVCTQLLVVTLLVVVVLLQLVRLLYW